MVLFVFIFDYFCQTVMKMALTQQAGYEVVESSLFSSSLPDQTCFVSSDLAVMIIKLF